MSKFNSDTVKNLKATNTDPRRNSPEDSIMNFVNDLLAREVESIHKEVERCERLLAGEVESIHKEVEERCERLRENTRKIRDVLSTAVNEYVVIDDIYENEHDNSVQIIEDIDPFPSHNNNNVQSAESNEVVTVTSDTSSDVLVVDSPSTSGSTGRGARRKKDEETNHKSESESTTIAASAKFPRPRFSPPSKLPKAGENSPEAAGKSGADRPTFPRKYKPGKSKSITTTQAPDQNEEEVSTLLQKFLARFKSRSNKDIVVTARPAHKSGRYSPKAPKGVYSSRKFARSSTSGPDTTVTETERPKPRKFSIETSALSTKDTTTRKRKKKSEASKEQVPASMSSSNSVLPADVIPQLEDTTTRKREKKSKASKEQVPASSSSSNSVLPADVIPQLEDTTTRKRKKKSEASKEQVPASMSSSNSVLPADVIPQLEDTTTRKREKKSKASKEQVPASSSSSNSVLPADVIPQLENEEQETESSRVLGDCPMCLEPFSKEISSTICGHVFCTLCIVSAIELQKCCPNCRKRLTLKEIHPLFI